MPKPIGKREVGEVVNNFIGWLGAVGEAALKFVPKYNAFSTFEDYIATLATVCSKDPDYVVTFCRYHFPRAVQLYREGDDKRALLHLTPEQQVVFEGEWHKAASRPGSGVNLAFIRYKVGRFTYAKFLKAVRKGKSIGAFEQGRVRCEVCGGVVDNNY